MVLTLYKVDPSPPSRAAHMMVDLLGLETTLIDVDLPARAHLRQEYLEINPQHTVPTLVDDDFCIWDSSNGDPVQKCLFSHAIAAYLVGKYASDDSLYPKDLKKRALVDQRLHFDSGVLFPATRGTVEPILFLGQTCSNIPEERVVVINNAYELLNALLASSGPWLAGDQLTIADICSIVNVTSLDSIVPINETKYPHVTAWMKKCSQLPTCKKINAPGTEQFKAMVQSKLK